MTIVWQCEKTKFGTSNDKMKGRRDGWISLIAWRGWMIGGEDSSHRERGNDARGWVWVGFGLVGKSHRNRKKSIVIGGPR